MREAINMAFVALSREDVPVGCVITDKTGIVSCGFNTREFEKTPLGHAEINAIREASSVRKSKRLTGCTLYVTLEPCPMCTGAIIESFIDTVVFGAYDRKMGACGSVMNIADYPGLCRRVNVRGGILERECSFILESFFKKLRRRDG